MVSRWILALVLFLTSTAVRADNIDDCNQSVDYALTIKGCTALINESKLTGRNAVRAFDKRANAHKEKGEHDLALADYNKVIELDPNSELGYIGRAETYEKMGDYGGAIGDYTKALELDPRSAWTLNRRGEAHKRNGNYDSAISDYTKSTEVDPGFCCIEDSRADAYLMKGDYDASVADYTKSIERNPNSSGAYNGRAWVYFKAGNAAQGLPDVERALELNPNDPAALDTRGHILEALGRRDEAIADLRSALAKDPSIQESKDALQRLGALQPLDELDVLRERIIKLDHAYMTDEAIAAAKEYAKAVARRHGSESLDYAHALDILADLDYAHASKMSLFRNDATESFSEAEAHARRALAIRVNGPNVDQLEVARSLTNLSAFLERESKFAEAEALAQKALYIRESALRPDHPRVAESLNNLAAMLFRQRKYMESEQLERRALVILEKEPDSLGAPGERLLGALVNLAAILEREGREEDAQIVYRRALSKAESVGDGRQKDIEDGAPAPSPDASKLGKGSYFLQFGLNWPAVLYTARMNTRYLAKTRERIVEGGDRDSLAVENRSLYNDPSLQTRVRAAYRMGSTDRQFQEEGFAAAQQMLLNSTARAVTLMAARFRVGAGALANLVREQQDLIGRRSEAYNLVHENYDFGQISRIEQSEESLRQSISELDRSLDAIDLKLKSEFPDYAALAMPEPLSISDVQSRLGNSEAMLFVLDLDAWAPPVPEESFIWIITKTDSRWVRSDLGSTALRERVAFLRCGLDFSNWIDTAKWLAVTEDAKRRKADQDSRREHCQQLTGMLVKATDLLPFDLEKSHELYRALFGEIEDQIKDKSLLIVSSGPLAQLPFHVLVTEKPDIAIPRDGASYAKAKWLGAQHPITVLPSVASLKSLRDLAKTSAAPKPFVGFGNPLLDGNPSDSVQVRRASAARKKQSCPPPLRPYKRITIAGIEVPTAFTSLFIRGMGDVAALRRQPPLPETADELCAVAHQLGAKEADIYLGTRATESSIKKLSIDGILASYRIVHFATHGLLAGETELYAKSLAEPALLLTPPKTASDEDDGLLTASEIAQLSLDADGVLLSACNTAAGGEKGNTDALSGLARAFFYAGARSLLVSHWYVNSNATVALVTRSLIELTANPEIGRTEALRLAMVALISSGGTDAHPSHWAPFVVVGEGGTNQTAINASAKYGISATSPVPLSTSAQAGPARSVEGELGQPKAKKERARRKTKPSSEWDWLWGE